MVSGKSEEQRKAERTESQGPLNKMGWCQVVLAAEGSNVCHFVVGMPFATWRTRGQQGQATFVRERSEFCSLEHGMLWRAGGGYEKSSLASKRLSWTPVLGRA